MEEKKNLALEKGYRCSDNAAISGKKTKKRGSLTLVDEE
jgi:hypothetical protein